MIAGEFDLSVGSMIGFAGVAIAIPVTMWGWPVWTAVIFAFAVACAVGWINGYITVKSGLPSFIVTLAGLFVLRGLTIGATRAITGRTQIPGIKAFSENDWLAPYFGNDRLSRPVPVAGRCRLDRQAAERCPIGGGHPGLDRLVAGPHRHRHLGAAAHPLRQLDLRLWRRQERRAQCRRAGRPGEDHPVRRHRLRRGTVRRHPGAEVRLGRHPARLLKEFEAIIAVVIGGTLLTGGYGSAIGPAFGALIFGTVQMGIFYTGVDTDWFKVFVGVMVLIAVLFNNYIRKRMTEAG